MWSAWEWVRRTWVGRRPWVETNWRSAGIDEDGGAAAALADDEGVREVARMHGSREQHGR
jgi:hypothetical protein